MHHGTFLFTACFLGGAFVAAAKSSTSASAATDPANTTSEEPLLYYVEIPKTFPELIKFRESQKDDPQYLAFRNWDHEVTKGTKDTEEQFDEQLNRDDDVNVDEYVTILPLSIQPYMRSYYAQQVSIVDAFRAGEAPGFMMPTTTTTMATMAKHKTKTSTGASMSTGTGAVSSIPTNTQSKSSPQKATAIGNTPIYPTEEPSMVMTALRPTFTIIPLSLRRSLSSPPTASTPVITDTVGTGTAPSSPISSTSLPNAAAGATRQAMTGLLGKAAGAFALAVAGLVFLL